MQSRDAHPSISPSSPHNSLELGLKKTLRQFTNGDIDEIAQLLVATAKHEDIFDSVLASKVDSLNLPPLQRQNLVNQIKAMVEVAK